MAIYRQAAAPAYEAGGLWFDSDDGNRMYYGEGGNWVDLGAIDTDLGDFTDSVPVTGDQMVAKRGAGVVNLLAQDFITRDGDSVFRLGDHNEIGPNGAYLGFGASYRGGAWRNRVAGQGGGVIRNEGGQIGFWTGENPGAADSVIAGFALRSYLNSGGDWVHYSASHFYFGANPAEVNPIDTSGLGMTLANGAALGFYNFSGLVIVNNHNNGAIGAWIMGGGVVVQLGASNTIGTMQFSSGPPVNYYFTNNLGSPQYYSFTAIRTRTTA